MDGLLKETLDLQPRWDAQNTSEMQRRGIVIRQLIPAEIRAHNEALAAALDVPLSDLGIEGKDGTGLKTEIPWVRVFSKERAPRATMGWYVVYLFSARGDNVYLSLNQGTTRWTGTDFAPRDPAELKARVDWARPLLQPLFASRDDLTREIVLQAAKSNLGPGYEAGNVVAIAYARDQVPDETTLVDDLIYMSQLLQVVYKAEGQSLNVPGTPAPEIVEAEEAAAHTAGKRVRRVGGQGLQLTAGERRAVELQAMRVATGHFQWLGWSIKDVSAKESYDLRLQKGDERLHVEVKGTTSTGTQIVLTRSEVEKQRVFAPANALVVVHSIELDRTATPPRATGGILHCVSPWTIEETDLTVVSYFYRTGL
ncbi:MAG TPA: DUF3578 domain-containing protein [Streptosporangiaceae bacterium]|nr:DUF3578 domain-containing protein [Streptosporangiaceae bacterium]